MVGSTPILQFLFGNPERVLIRFLAISARHPQPMVSPPVQGRHNALPISIEEGGAIKIAMSNPGNVVAVDDIRTLTNRHVVPVVATHDDVVGAIDRFCRADTELESLQGSLEETVEEDLDATEVAAAGIDRGVVHLMTGMPPSYAVPLMAMEQAIYGLVAGLLFKRFKLNIYVALLAAMIVGRLIFGLGLFLLGMFMDLPYGPAVFFSSAGPIVTGLPGIALQIFLIPLVVAAVNEASRKVDGATAGPVTFLVMHERVWIDDVAIEAEGADLLMIDTAGRLQNRADLMEELAKIVRVIRKKDPDAPHNTLLVLDATTGQNALNQVKIFQQVSDVSGLVMTKLDGTAKGGVLVALADKFGLPIHAIGVGEQIDDLQVFDDESFVQALFGTLRTEDETTVEEEVPE